MAEQEVEEDMASGQGYMQPGCTALDLEGRQGQLDTERKHDERDKKSLDRKHISV